MINVIVKHTIGLPNTNCRLVLLCIVISSSVLVYVILILQLALITVKHVLMTIVARPVILAMSQMQQAPGVFVSSITDVCSIETYTT